MKTTRLLAVASGGGHWVQLLRLRHAWRDCDVAFATVDPIYRDDVAGHRFYVVQDATRWQKVRMVRMILQLIAILLRERPHIVLSTGAAPGFFALMLARRIGARTIWLDSCANIEQLSTSGQRVGPYADLWLTQWPELAKPSGPQYLGGVL